MVDMGTRECLQIWRRHDNPCPHAGHSHVFCEARGEVFRPCERPELGAIRKEIKSARATITALEQAIDEQRSRLRQLTRLEVIQKTLRGERQPAPDQADLTRFKLCA